MDFSFMGMFAYISLPLYVYINISMHPLAGQVLSKIDFSFMGMFLFAGSLVLILKSTIYV